MSRFHGRSLKLIPLAAVFLSQVGIRMAGAEAPDKPDPVAAEKGKITYQRYCTPCHGQAGRGDGSLAGDLRTPVPDLTGLTRRNNGAYPFDRVVSLIDGRTPARAHGTSDMPAWGETFKKTEGTGASSPDAAVRNLAHYIWSLQAAAASRP
jgi:mono/diheme cytochrome c family protein